MQPSIITGTYYLQKDAVFSAEEEQRLIETIRWGFSRRKEMKEKWEMNKEPKNEYNYLTRIFEPNLALINLKSEILYTKCLLKWKKNNRLI